MDATADAWVRTPPPDPAKWPSLALSALVHLLLIGALFLGVQWRSQPSDTVEVELWRPAPVETAISPPAVKDEPKPPLKPEPKPVPRAEPRPEPKPTRTVEPRPLPPPVVKAEPRPVVKVEPRPPAKADIAVKEDKKTKDPKADRPKDDARKEAPRKEEPKVKTPESPPRKETPPKVSESKVKESKPKEAPPKSEPDRSQRMRQEAEKEARQRERDNAARDQRAKLAEADAEMKQLKQQGEREAAKQRARTLDTGAYKEMIRVKIRGNINRSPNIDGGEATFKVTQLPSGDVLEVRLQKSSGNPAFDEAVERAIRRSSPLPKPPDPELFQRELILRFRPES